MLWELTCENLCRFEVVLVLVSLVARQHLQLVLVSARVVEQIYYYYTLVPEKIYYYYIQSQHGVLFRMSSRASTHATYTCQQLQLERLPVPRVDLLHTV